MCGLAQNRAIVTLSPDLDLSLETLTGEGSDVIGVRSVRSDGTLLGVDRDNMYTFTDCQGRDLSASEVREWIEEAVIQMQLMGNQRDVGGGDDILESALARHEHEQPADPSQSNDVGISSHDVMTPAGMAITKRDKSGSSGKWVLLEGYGNLLPGSDPPHGDLQLGKSRGYVVLADGTEVALKYVDKEGTCNLGNNTVEITATAAAELNSRLDARVFPIGRDLTGKRFGNFSELVRKGVPYKCDDCPVSGPHTVQWLCLFFASNGGSPIAFHYRWMSEVRLDYAARGTSEHLTLCQALEYMTIYDFIDPCGSACAELICRKIQIIHDLWRHKLPSLGGKDNLEDDSFLILGTHETRNNVGFSPALSKWIGKEVSDEFLAAKERRKAREERLLANPKAASKS